MRCISTCAEHFRVWPKSDWIGRRSTKGALKRLAKTVGQMTSGLNLTVPLIVALTLALVTLAWADEFDVEDYSNEYEDVRPHLVYPDDPRLDKRIGDAAREFGQNITQAWHSMVDSFKNYFEELKNLFADTTDPNAANEVFSDP
ncbi:uncharacterized protein LOC108049814 [Drosophila rhopaloa]|uniref:Uncharacterized protein LOC108049814 n=1 Tax=Drosophila rhopaloa TaxID=1041015 RepID=A0A6P4F8R7_DRORH|nr:uncharacterized protein LOC108049814 [Drosophila rhopaloa]